MASRLRCGRSTEEHRDGWELNSLTGRATCQHLSIGQEPFDCHKLKSGLLRIPTCTSLARPCLSGHRTCPHGGREMPDQENIINKMNTLDATLAR